MKLGTYPVAAIFLGSMVLAVFAHDSATGVVKERMELMKSVQEHMKSVGEMILGKREFVAETVEKAGEVIAEHADEIPDKFPEDSIESLSDALPAIWQDWDEFTSLAEELEINALYLAEAADGASGVAEIRSHFAAIGKTCSACHEDFRRAD